MKELVLGCGNYRKKRIYLDDDEYINPTFVDIDRNTNPDILWDLNKLPLPFENDEFDEIHAYDVLEHLGTQGDINRFFYEFSEYYRILKNDGMFFISCPGYNTKWAWGDPGHTRIMTKETFTYLNQGLYNIQVGKTQMTDYRDKWKGNFQLVQALLADNDNDSNSYILRCIK